MGAAYPLEMRQKALAAVDRGEKKLHVSRMFGISRNTLDDWLKRRAATGQIAPKAYRSRGPVPKIADLAEFRQFVATRGHLTQQQMADEWPETVSNRTIGKALKAIGYTRKKDLWVPRTGR
jgi:transposase